MLKPIQLQRGIIKIMSFEEIYQRYLPLLKNRATRWAQQYEYDEMFQVANIGLWEAYRFYKPDKQATFGAYAIKVIENEMKEYNKKHNKKFSKKTTQIKSIVSYNGTILNDDGEIIDFQELVGEDKDFSQEIIDNFFWEELFKKLTIKQRKFVFSRYVEDYDVEKIAEINSVSSNSVYRAVQRGLKKLKRLYMKENTKVQIVD